MSDDRRRVDDWQNATDLKLDQAIGDIAKLNEGQAKQEQFNSTLVRKLDENTAASKEAAAWARNLEALNTLAKWASSVGRWALPLLAVWTALKGWLHRGG